MISSRTFLIIGLVLALLIGGCAVFLASTDPDGLESTALVSQGDKTITGDAPPDAAIHEDRPDTFTYDSPLQDYSLGGALGKPGEVIAVIAGILAVFLIMIGVSRLAKRPADKK